MTGPAGSFENPIDVARERYTHEVVSQIPPQHGTVAVGFFLLFTVAFVCYGAGDLRTGAHRWGLFGLALAAVHVGGWAVWIAAGTPGGLALPELVGSGCVSTWILGTAVRMW